MAMGNGAGKTEKILERIAATLETHTEILLRHAEEIGSGFAAVNARLDGMSARLDGVLELVGGHHRSLESRVTRIEEHLGLKKS